MVLIKVSGQEETRTCDFPHDTDLVWTANIAYVRKSYNSLTLTHANGGIQILIIINIVYK